MNIALFDIKYFIFDEICKLRAKKKTQNFNQNIENLLENFDLFLRIHSDPYSLSLSKIPIKLNLLEL